MLSGKGSHAFTSHKIPVPVTTRGSLHALHSSDRWGSCFSTGGGNCLLPSCSVTFSSASGVLVA